jgi:hypothetical protein
MTEIAPVITKIKHLITVLGPSYRDGPVNFISLRRIQIYPKIGRAESIVRQKEGPIQPIQVNLRTSPHVQLLPLKCDKQADR